MSLQNQVLSVPTLIAPLAIRAQDAMTPYSILNDQTALSLMQQLPAHLQQHLTQRKSTITFYGILARTLYFDRLAQQFIQHYPNGVIIQLGCGLDTRFQRIPLPATHYCYQLDLPEVIQLRHSLFAPMENETLLPYNICNLAWLKHIQPKHLTQPVLLLAEGLFYFLTASQIQQVLTQLMATLPYFELAYDCFSSLVIRFAKIDSTARQLNAPFLWASNNETWITQLDPHLHCTHTHSILQLAHSFSWQTKLLSKLPIFNQGMRIVELQYAPHGVLTT